MSKDFLIGALDDAVLFLRIRRGKRVIRTNESRSRKQSLDQCVWPRVCFIGTDTRCGKELNPPRESVNDDEYIKIPFIIGFEGTNVDQMQNL